MIVPSGHFLTRNRFINVGDVVIVKNKKDKYYGHFASVVKVTKKRIFILLPDGVTNRKRKNLMKAADHSLLPPV